MTNGRTTPAPRPRAPSSPLVSPGPTVSSPGPQINISFGLPVFFFDSFFRRVSRRDDVRNRASGGRNLLPLIPVPQRPRFPEQPPAPRPRPQPLPRSAPFPGGTPANDPVFRGPFGGVLRTVGRFAGVLGAVISVFELGRAIEEELDRQAADEARRGREQDARRERRRARDAQPLPEINFPLPAPAPAPQPEIRPDRPRRIPLPTPVPRVRPRPVPRPRPRRAPRPQTPFPEVFPAPPTAPGPSSPRLPRARPGTPRVPNFFVGLPPLPSPRVRPRPRLRPDINPFTPGNPVGVPNIPTTPGLTPVVGTLVSSPPRPRPLQDTAEDRCQVVKRRRRKKGKCREGFFVETPGETKFITWRSRECDTSTGRIRNVFTTI